MAANTQMRYSMACRAITREEKVVSPGHGGRWMNSSVAKCPRCHRPMVLTGKVMVKDL